MNKRWSRRLLRDLSPGALVRTIPGIKGGQPQLGIYLGGSKEDAWGGLNFNHTVRFGDKDSSCGPTYEVEVYL